MDLKCPWVTAHDYVQHRHHLPNLTNELRNMLSGHMELPGCFSLLEGERLKMTMSKSDICLTALRFGGAINQKVDVNHFGTTLRVLHLEQTMYWLTSARYLTFTWQRPQMNSLVFSREGDWV
jgi:hypothetical protein